MDWQRADLAAWGETLQTPHGRYTKTWRYSSVAANIDGCLFRIEFEGRVIAADIDGQTIDEAEENADRIVNEHLQRQEPPNVTDVEAEIPTCHELPAPHVQKKEYKS